ncbi:MAG TPA: hypothetical protein VK524_04535, partial [Polyangiaceae bacterium]|nr:hypothetical protein [Polyangiaceae bacterium]
CLRSRSLDVAPSRTPSSPGLEFVASEHAFIRQPDRIDIAAALAPDADLGGAGILAGIPEE